MRVWVEYDPASNICTIKHEEVNMQSEADIQEWRRLVLGALSKAIPEGRKAWILVDFNSFDIGQDIISRYGEVAMEVRAYAKQVIRYNCDNILTNVSVRSKAVTHGYRSNICKDREEALMLLDKLKEEDRA